MSGTERTTLFPGAPEVYRPASGADGADVATSDETLPQLIHGAAWARRFVQMHNHAARQCLRAARVAGFDGDSSLSAQLLREAKDEHERARICTRFAVDREARADAMAMDAGVHRAIGRRGRFSPAGATS